MANQQTQQTISKLKEVLNRQQNVSSTDKQEIDKLISELQSQSQSSQSEK